MSSRITTIRLNSGMVSCNHCACTVTRAARNDSNIAGSTMRSESMVGRSIPITECIGSLAAVAARTIDANTLLALAVELTVDIRTGTRWRVDNGCSYRPTKAPADHSRCGAPWPPAHVGVFARHRAAMDPAATRSLRAGRDAALPAVCL